MSHESLNIIQESDSILWDQPIRRSVRVWGPKLKSLIHLLIMAITLEGLLWYFLGAPWDEHTGSLCVFSEIFPLLVLSLQHRDTTHKQKEQCQSKRREDSLPAPCYYWDTPPEQCFTKVIWMATVPPATSGYDFSFVLWVLDVLTELIVRNGFEQETNQPNHETYNDSNRSRLKWIKIWAIPDICEKWGNHDHVHKDAL